jgi:hypothetical protein
MHASCRDRQSPRVLAMACRLNSLTVLSARSDKHSTNDISICTSAVTRTHSVLAIDGLRVELSRLTDEHSTSDSDASICACVRKKKKTS